MLEKEPREEDFENSSHQKVKIKELLMSEGGGVSPPQEAETTLSESASRVSSHSFLNRTGVGRTANTSTSDIMDLGKLIKKTKTFRWDRQANTLETVAILPVKLHFL